MKHVEIEGYTHAELANKAATFGFLKISHDGALIRAEGEHLRVSDGYHTFDELYEHRIRLFIELCRLLRKDLDHRGVWASTLHSDGTSFGDWFILGINKEKDAQITYHLPARYWHEVCEFAEILERAPEWDGHTSGDVLERLKVL